MALHALEYCERLFFLEEVEEIRVADAAVYAGRALHDALEEEGEVVHFQLESQELGIRGKVDGIRRRNGEIIPYEHKRGRPTRTEEGSPRPWSSDEVQLGAYALLLEEAFGERIPEGRIRYHGDNVLVRVPIDDRLRAKVRRAVARARELTKATQRPPITENERACGRCSLAPVCLPEESRKARAPGYAATRLFPADDDRRAIHVLGHGTRVRRAGNEIVVEPRDGEPLRAPVEQTRSVSIHGFASVSSQVLQLCAEHDVAVHWFGSGGWYLGSFMRDDHAVQRRIRQYGALSHSAVRLALARRLVLAKVEAQLRFTLRASRGKGTRPDGVADALRVMRNTLRHIASAEDNGQLLGYEGAAAAAYFSALPSLVAEGVDSQLRPSGRSRRPPQDAFNALLSFGYAVLLREVTQAIRVVGLEPALGIYHEPRSSAPPLALDLMELFRVACVDIPVLAAVNRVTFDAGRDFVRAGAQVWLSDSGRRKAIEVLERRFLDEWRHPVLKYSLSYRRHIELEVRLLEKEWSGEAGLFARTRLR